MKTIIEAGMNPSARLNIILAKNPLVVALA